MKKFRMTAAFTALLVAGCQPGQPEAAKVVSAVTPHGLDASAVARGEGIYQANCAACHGDKAQGAPDWSKKGADGKFPPPPLNAEGHAWHHPMSWLVAMVRDGTLLKGGDMPGWAGTLDDAQIRDVLMFVQSQWPAEVFQAWQRADAQATANTRHRN